jgi:CheY-like chemotaxis protein
MKQNMREVVVIDRSPLSCNILSVALQRAGYRVRCFTDSREALRMLFHGGDPPPDLIFVNLNVPKPQFSGLKTIQLVRKNFLAWPIINMGCSERGQVLPRLLARLAGANAYVSKPFIVEYIVAAVTTLLPP